jgi:hypothetical protein
MPDRRQHRGPHPEDEQLFASDQWSRLRAAVDDLCWLFNHGYAAESSLKLVGDRYALEKRQRVAVARCACSDAAAEKRVRRCVPLPEISGQVVLLDGYNILTTIEAALAGGVLLLGRDGCLRDMASVHGSFRRVAETRPAIAMIGRQLAAWGVAECRWYLDRPVSNSGRLKMLLLEDAARHAWPWQVELEMNPDRLLKFTEQIVATTDSAILDAGPRWTNLARRIVAAAIPTAQIIDLSGNEGSGFGVQGSADENDSKSEF